MIIDTSAVIAILAGEPDAVHYAQRIEQDPTPRIGAPAMLEASIVLTRWFGDAAEAALDGFVRESGAEIVAFDLPQLRAAQDAYARYGKGRHPAGLNFGDCMSYALARVCDEPLLFKGDDFAQTDIEAVR
ncbi:MAG: type II toxin-antitoxin system VapC family toxin [Arenimonas sp.]|nr:type II toxin-antitoxin system VapC family toxin [Arenimonas sp.]MBP6626810.1 type II toxin-antitoxin system VapC family toxin [Arenimonas sp.]